MGDIARDSGHQRIENRRGLPSEDQGSDMNNPLIT